MKKYLLFSGNTNYPMGGVHDFKAHADTIEELEIILKHSWANKDMVWADIVEYATMQVIKSYYQDNGKLEIV